MRVTSRLLVLLTLLCAAVFVTSYAVRDGGSCARRRQRQQQRLEEHSQADRQYEQGVWERDGEQHHSTGPGADGQYHSDQDAFYVQLKQSAAPAQAKDTTGDLATTVETDDAPEQHRRTGPEQSVDEAEQQGADEARHEPEGGTTPPQESAEEANDWQLREGSSSEQLDAADRAQAQQQELRPAKARVQAAAAVVSGSNQPAYDTVEYHNQGLQDLLLSGNALTPRDPSHPPGSLRGILFPEEQQLREDGEVCATSLACCSSQCYRGVCCSDLKKLNGNSCKSSYECCSGVCEDSKCCAAHATIGATCTANAGCCSNTCAATTSAASAPKACCPPNTLAYGATCTRNIECCSGVCSGNTCDEPGPLAPLGDVCQVNADCRSGSCNRFPGLNPPVDVLPLEPDPNVGECCPPGLLPRGEVCTSDTQCCKGSCLLVDEWTEGRKRCCALGTAAIQAPCNTNADCCGNNCVGGRCERPTCFSGDSTVRVRGLLHPVTMRELRTGQQVECLHSGSDLMAPTTPTWCEVINFVHADSVTVQQQRLSFSRPDGSSGSITVTPTHLVYKLTGDTPLTTSAGSVNAFGSFKLLAARDVVPGDRLVVGSSPVDASAGFVIGTVTAVEGVQAEGLYLPVIEHPYLLVDGVVMPLWTWTGVPLITPSGAAGAPNALLHYTFAPLFMQHMQPLHTPGLQGKWDNNASMWPGVHTVLSALHSKQAVTSGRVAVDFSAAQDLFLPRYQAWKAAQGAHSSSSNPAGGGEVPGAITLEQVLLTLDAVMVPLGQQ